MAGSGRDHAPAPLRNRANEFDRARHHKNAVTIIRLAALQPAGFRFSVKMRSDGANYFPTADAMGDGHDLLGVDFLLASPCTPLPLYRAGGIHKNSVEIEKNCCAVKLGHSLF